MVLKLVWVTDSFEKLIKTGETYLPHKKCTYKSFSLFQENYKSLELLHGLKEKTLDAELFY